MAQTIAEIEDRSVISPMMQKYIETKEKLEFLREELQIGNKEKGLNEDEQSL